MFNKYLPVMLLASTLSVSAFADDDKKRKHHKEEGFDWDNMDIVLTATGGLAWVNADLSQDLEEGFTHYDYDSSSSDGVSGLWGAFIGVEGGLADDIDGQLGFSYYSTEADGSGTLTQGVTPETANEFGYDYDVTSQQILLEGKLIWELEEMWRPYITAGLGIGINRTDNFSVDNDGGAIVSSIEWDETTKTSFSYMVGLGMDVALTKNVYLGLAYRFTGLGEFGFDSGEFQADGELAAGELNDSSLTANEIVAQLSYLFDL